MATIDLSQLPPPDVVEELDYESLLEERKTTLISLYPADQQEAISRTLTLESEPLVKLLQENAYRELILRPAGERSRTRRDGGLCRRAVIWISLRRISTFSAWFLQPADINTIPQKPPF